MITKCRAMVLASLILFGACTSPNGVDLEGGTLEVTGIILNDATGHPLADFPVRIIGWDFGDRGVYPVTSDFTDDDGRFTLTKRYFTKHDCERDGPYFLQVEAQEGIPIGGLGRSVVHAEWDGDVVIDGGDTLSGLEVECGETHQAIVRIGAVPSHDLG